MRIRLIAAGRRVPAWVADGFADYSRRFPRNLSLELVEISLGIRSKKSNPKRAVEQEGRRMLEAVRHGERIVALDENGTLLSTAELANVLESWHRDGRDVALLVGGPDGLAEQCIAGADFVWSLSPLTLPHALVRIVVTEQLYRAWTVLTGHPYHRALRGRSDK